MTSQSIEQSNIPPAILINCSSDETTSSESNAIFGYDNTVPINPLLLRGNFNGIPVKILKDDGCNTDVVSRAFVKKYETVLNIVSKKLILKHSCGVRLKK
jgi:hypothetical protein